MLVRLERLDLQDIMFILIPFQQVRASTYAPSKYVLSLFSLKGRGVGGDPSLPLKTKYVYLMSLRHVIP